MTEDDAKTKWCPQARVVTIHPEAGHIAGPANRTEVCGEDHFTKPMGSFCIASACMAWRWFGTHVRNDSLAEPSPNVPGDELVWSNQTYGTCGLAGSWFAEMRRDGAAR